MTKKNEEIFALFLPEPTPTTLSLWSRHIPQILEATRVPGDGGFQFHDFYASLLHILTPDRMQRAVKTLPLDWTPVHKSFQILYHRWKAVQSQLDEYRETFQLALDDPIDPQVMSDIQKDPDLPPKLSILVMGGSVTMGVVGDWNPVGKFPQSAAWPVLFSNFVTNLFGNLDLIQVHVLAIGGTNTESGTTLWDYSIVPKDVPYPPDILINAYSTNDVHVNSMNDAKARNKTLEESLIELGQNFIRQVMTPKKQCGHSPPLLLFVDDYLGNEQNEILATMVSSQKMNLLSGYYGTASISYADAVRDVVYGDSKEWFFSSDWYYKGGNYGRQIHPHLGMHTSMAWIVTFYLINLATTYCSLPKLPGKERYHAGMARYGPGKEDYNFRISHGMPQLRDAGKPLKGRPSQKPRGLPPLLTKDLSLENVTEAWLEDSNANADLWKAQEECAADGHQINETHSITNPCIFAWVGSINEGMTKPDHLMKQMAPVIMSHDGWSAADDNRKLGWVPTGGLGSKFTLGWNDISQPVKAVNFMVMKSYGEKWANSTLEVKIWSGDDSVGEEIIHGFHDKHTSETYNIKIPLHGEGLKKGSELRISHELIAGNTFKILGMAVCDH